MMRRPSPSSEPPKRSSSTIQQETFMMMPRRTALFACAVIALAGASPAFAADKITVGTVGAGSTVLWPTYIAVEKGFFSKRDVAVDLIAVPSNAGMQQQLAAHALDL